jgi:hypothetical protein
VSWVRFVHRFEYVRANDKKYDPREVHSVRRVFPGTAGRMAYQTVPSRDVTQFTARVRAATDDDLPALRRMKRALSEQQ